MELAMRYKSEKRERGKRRKKQHASGKGVFLLARLITKQKGRKG